jgi:hypothetical protein
MKGSSVLTVIFPLAVAPIVLAQERSHLYLTKALNRCQCLAT